MGYTDDRLARPSYVPFKEYNSLKLYFGNLNRDESNEMLYMSGTHKGKLPLFRRTIICARHVTYSLY